MLDRDAAIVGMSVFCPAGECAEEFWEGIARGGDFITDAPPDVIDPVYFTDDGTSNGMDRFYCRRGGFSGMFKVDPLRYGILPIAAAGIDPEQLISMAGVELALHDAGIIQKKAPLQKCSIIIGRGNFAGIVALRSTEIIRNAYQFTEIIRDALPGLTDADAERIRKAYQSRQGRYQADMAIGTMPNLVASLVANRFDMHGPAYTVDAACASGIVAVNHSMALLRSGQCDICVAGAMHSGHSPMFWGAFDMMGALSRRQVIAPFSKDADGLLIGQGGGFVTMKRLGDAVRDGDRIYAVVKETSVCSDGAGSHVLVTSVAGQVRVLAQAWERAGMDPDRVGYVEAHGTATIIGDRTEIASLKEFFGDSSRPRAYVGSVKSNIGHTMPAAGMIGLIKAALALYHRKIPPTLHCERPLPQMLETRFLPPQELVDWDGAGLPLVAGVNAFGFGGINAHAILTAYEPGPGAPRQPKPRRFTGETYWASAKTGEELARKLEAGDFTNTGGDFRIAIINPDGERLAKALEIVRKGAPWRGRMDIWYENEPLLSRGGKLVFLFAGFYIDELPEMQSFCDALDLPGVGDMLGAHGVEGETARYGMGVYFTKKLTMQGFEKMGIDADIYAGHSIGEWDAAIYAGIVDGDVDALRATAESWGAHDEPIDKYPIIAVSGSNCRAAQEWCDKAPGLYMMNDNCPSQILLCGERGAVEELQRTLDKERIFYTRLPYGAGHHTPLLEGALPKSRAFMEGVRVREGKAPVWSATTLEPVPTDKGRYCELVESQLTRPVYFRGLIEKLYDEQGARVFVQVGPGSLVGFVDDTLKGRPFGSIATASTARGGAEQLRRVMALLFVEGIEVDPIYLSVKPMYYVSHSLMSIPRGAPVLKELPELREAVGERYGGGGALLGLGGGAQFGQSGGALQGVAGAAASNVRGALEAQRQVMEAYGKAALAAPTGAAEGATAGVTKYTGAPAPAPTGAAAPTGTPAPAAIAMPIAATAPTGTPAPGHAPAPPRTFKEHMRLTLDDHPYLIDHSIIRQPPGWPVKEDLNPVVPLAMTIELLAEAAKRHAPRGMKLVRIGKLVAYRWITVNPPFDAEVSGEWKGGGVVEIELSGHAKAEFTFAEEWPAQPDDYGGEGDIDIGEVTVKDPPTVAELYDRYAFHGPLYHSSMEAGRIHSRGIANLAERRGGKGSLLDIVGQQFGLFLHLTQTENTISFPVRMKEMEFYQDISDQDGIFEHTAIVTGLKDSSITGDSVLKRDGRLWCVTRGYVLQRFPNYAPIWNVILKPQLHTLAQEVAPGVFCFALDSQSSAIEFLALRYLNLQEKEEYSKITSPAARREHLFSRIAAKDAARSACRLGGGCEGGGGPDGGGCDGGGGPDGGGELAYPVEIAISHGEGGGPRVEGFGRMEAAAGRVRVSLAHKRNAAVGMARAGQPCGVDIELVEDKGEGFHAAAFTDAERALVRAARQAPAEAAMRFWVAKEACAKKAGSGLKGNPKRFEVTAADGDTLSVGGCLVQTMRIEHEYIAGEAYVIGWTL